MALEDELVALQAYETEKLLYGVNEARRRLYEKLPSITDPDEELRRIEAEKHSCCGDRYNMYCCGESRTPMG